MRKPIPVSAVLLIILSKLLSLSSLLILILTAIAVFRQSSNLGNNPTIISFTSSSTFSNVCGSSDIDECHIQLILSTSESKTALSLLIAGLGFFLGIWSAVLGLRWLRRRTQESSSESSDLDFDIHLQDAAKTNTDALFLLITTSSYAILTLSILTFIFATYKSPNSTSSEWNLTPASANSVLSGPFSREEMVCGLYRLRRQYGGRISGIEDGEGLEWTRRACSQLIAARWTVVTVAVFAAAVTVIAGCVWWIGRASKRMQRHGEVRMVATPTPRSSQ